MPMDQAQGGAIPPAPAVQPQQTRQVSEQDKALAGDWLKRIEEAQSQDCVKEAVKRFERNRKLVRGLNPSSTEKSDRIRANLYFANLAMLRPQVYAKDPEFAIKPTRSVGPAQLPAVQKFGATAEAVLEQLLVRECKLKKRAKRLVTGAYTTSVGWWKLCWQETLAQDPAIANRLDDTQDNLAQLQKLRTEIDDPSALVDHDLKEAQLRETLAGMQAQAEVVVSRGLTLDFVLSEDILVLDRSIRELGDYERAGALAHRVWMTRDGYAKTYGYKPERAKTYAEHGATGASSAGKAGKGSDLLCVWEIWDKDSNRVLHVCEGEEGFCRQPFTPDWTPERWYPFFALLWNEVDGSLYPLSDVELIEPLVTEYNEQRDDFVRDRRDCLPLNIARKGGSLTETDLQNIRNRRGGDLILVEGVSGAPISNDIWSGQLGKIDPSNYDTGAARADIEQIIGGGDASRGAVLKAKTATEAEILSQGLRGRSAERQDTLEDLLADVAESALQMCLRKLTPEEAMLIAGPDASWPSLSAEQVFEQVMVQVRAGSTGRPDRLQEQDRWTNLQPVIEKTVMTVAELYAKGQVQLGGALAEMLRETMRRFDERIDLDRYLPKAPEEGQEDPAAMQQELQAMREQMKALEAELQQAKAATERGLVSAAAQVATSQAPDAAAEAFLLLLGQLAKGLDARQNMEKTPEQGADDGAMPPEEAVPIQ